MTSFPAINVAVGSTTKESYAAIYLQVMCKLYSRRDIKMHIRAHDRGEIPKDMKSMLITEDNNSIILFNS